MTAEEAKKFIYLHGCEGDGAAYNSRLGEYPEPELVNDLVDSMRIVFQSTRGDDLLDRRLAAALFSLINQLEGNYARAVDSGEEIRHDLDVDLARLNDSAMAIFEDWEEFG